MVTLSNSIDNTIGVSLSGATNTFTVQNPSNTASSQAKILATVGGTTAGDAWTQYTAGTSQSYAIGLSNSNSQSLYISTAASGTVSPSTGTALVTLTSGGNLNKPLTSAFNAYVGTTLSNVTGDGTVYTVVFGTVLFDQNSNYNNSNGVFTAPVTGIYHFSSVIFLNNIVAQTGLSLSLTTSVASYITAYMNPSTIITSGFLAVSADVYTKLTAGQAAQMEISLTGSTKTVGVYAPYSFFSGTLVA